MMRNGAMWALVTILVVCALGSYALLNKPAVSAFQPEPSPTQPNEPPKSHFAKAVSHAQQIIRGTVVSRQQYERDTVRHTIEVNSVILGELPRLIYIYQSGRLDETESLLLQSNQEYVLFLQAGESIYGSLQDTLELTMMPDDKGEVITTARMNFIISGQPAWIFHIQNNRFAAQDQLFADLVLAVNESQPYEKFVEMVRAETKRPQGRLISEAEAEKRHIEIIKMP